MYGTYCKAFEPPYPPLAVIMASWSEHYTHGPPVLTTTRWASDIRPRNSGVDDPALKPEA